MAEKIDLIGQKFGRLLVIEEAENDASGHKRFKCLCDCGNVTVIRSYDLRKNLIVSCGCYSKEQSSKKFRKHGGKKERLYSVWKGMKRRCYSPNHKEYKNYGGRGITVCDEWLHDYSAFREFMFQNGL